MNLKLALYNNHLLFLLIILALIVGLGNPFLNYPLAYTIGDEFESQRAALLTIATRNPVQESYYLPLWNWLQIPFIGLTIIFLKIFQIYPSFEAVKEAVVFSPGMFLPISRILSAVISAASIVWLYKIGCLLLNCRAGIIAAVLFIFSYTRIYLSPFGRTTSLYVFFALAFLYYLLKFTRSKKHAHIYIALVSILLAIAAYPQAIALMPVLVITLLFTGSVKSLLKNPTTYFFLLFFSSIFMLLLVMTPGIFNHYIKQISLSSKDKSFIDKIVYYGYVLQFSEPVIILGSLWTLPKVLQKLTKESIIIISFGIFALIPYLMKNTSEPRYVYLFYLTLLIMFSLEIAKMTSALSTKKLSLVLSSLLIYPIIIDIRLITLLFKPTTRLLAQQYIVDSIPPNSPILANYDGLDIVPDLNSLSPVLMYNPRYHQSQHVYLKNYTGKNPQVKNIHFYSDLEYYLPKTVFTEFISRQSYNHIVISYYTKAEKLKMLSKLPMQNMDLEKSFYPSSTELDLHDYLKMSNPVREIVQRDRFGPYIEIYKKTDN